MSAVLLLTGILTCSISTETSYPGTGDVAQQFRALTALPEGFSLSSHTAANNCL